MYIGSSNLRPGLQKAQHVIKHCSACVLPSTRHARADCSCLETGAVINIAVTLNGN
jgi:hypothetical protein